ncbi:MAG: hypothetical protein ACXWYQ_05970 [Actinomycetota bacterium]
MSKDVEQPVPAPVASAARRPTRKGRRATIVLWVFAVLLLLAGLGAFWLAADADNTNEMNFAADYSALGARDAGTEAKTLDARVKKVKRAYDAYVAAQQVVFSTHEAVTDHFNQVLSPDDPLLFADNANARSELDQVIADFGKAVERERATRQAFVDQLALLTAEVTR